MFLAKIPWNHHVYDKCQAKPSAASGRKSHHPHLFALEVVSSCASRVTNEDGKVGLRQVEHLQESPMILMGKSGFRWRCSLKPIHWNMEKQTKQTIVCLSSLVNWDVNLNSVWFHRDCERRNFIRILWRSKSYGKGPKLRSQRQSWAQAIAVMVVHYIT